MILLIIFFMLYIFCYNIFLKNIEGLSDEATAQMAATRVKQTMDKCGENINKINTIENNGEKCLSIIEDKFKALDKKVKEASEKAQSVANKHMN